jgi:hypothetical protein
MNEFCVTVQIKKLIRSSGFSGLYKHEGTPAQGTTAQACLNARISLFLLFLEHDQKQTRSNAVALVYLKLGVIRASS